MLQQQYAAVSRRQQLAIGSTVFNSTVVGEGPPLVLLHGLGGSSRWWARNWRMLAHRHEVHLLDFAGAGQARRPFVLADAAADLGQWMEQSGLHSAHLLGHSLGGALALSLAAARPACVDKLILVAAAINLGVTAPQQACGSRRGPLPLSLLSTALHDVVSAGIFNMARVARALIRTDMGPTVAQVQAPTLLIWGAQDNAVPLDTAREFVRRKPGSTLAIIEEAGHVPMWDQPFAFNRVVNDYLAGRPIRP